MRWLNVRAAAPMPVWLLAPFVIDQLPAGWVLYVDLYKMGSLQVSVWPSARNPSNFYA